jgi:ferredoxin
MRSRPIARPVRLRVDPVACDGYGYCAELVPELIERDEWGYPTVSPDPVPAALTEVVCRAVRDCPTRALVLDDVPSATEPVI